jgi:hypothetical protein
MTNRRWVVISERARGVDANRFGLLVTWTLHGGSEFRRERVNPQYIHPVSQVREPGDQGRLIVDEVWAASKCITPLRDALPEELKPIGAFVAHEELDIGITNPGQVVRLRGSPENIERLVAFALQSGEEVYGLSDEERARFLAMDLEV